MAVFFIAFVAAFPAPLYASCPDITSYSRWVEYDWTLGCAGTTGSPGTTTLSCFSLPAHNFTASSSSATYSYTIQSGDPIYDTTKWSSSVYVDFNDNTNSSSNTLSISVSHTHNGVTTSHTMLNWNGALGDFACRNYGYFYFTAVVGDTITVTVNATNFSSASTTIKVAAPMLFNEI
jgi:hypothetical protein